MWSTSMSLHSNNSKHALLYRMHHWQLAFWLQLCCSGPRPHLDQLLMHRAELASGSVSSAATGSPLHAGSLGN